MMSSTVQAYDALPSETTSINTTICQPESRLSYDKTDASTVPPNPKSPSQTYISRIWTSWKWESAACILVLVTPIIIFATLYPHSGQPLPQWPFKISINSLLSVYAVVLKAAMGFILTSCIGQLQWTWFSETRPLTDMLHFDSATRSADGALGLIWRQRFRQPLTVLGCIIMVLAVTVDPFVQQLIRPVDCSVEISGAYTAMPRANVFVEEGDYAAISKEVEDLFYQAIFSPGQNPPWQCPTGNCTWPDPYGTVGICSSCQDVSSDVVFKATCLGPEYSFESHDPISGADCDYSNFTLESHYTSDFIDIETAIHFGAGNQNNTLIVADAFSAFGDYSPTSPTDASPPNFAFLMGSTANIGGQTDWTAFGNSNSTNVSEWSSQGYGAAACTLQPCVQIFNATISAGIVKEYLVESSSHAAWGRIRDEEGLVRIFAMIDTECSAKIQAPSNQDQGIGSRWLPYNYNLSKTARDSESLDRPLIDLPDDAMKLLESGCLYLISADILLIEAGWQLSGTIKAGGYVFPGTGEDALLSSFSGPKTIQSVYNWGHTDFERVRSSVENISDTLTKYMRTHGGGTLISGGTNFSNDAQGKMHHYATCLEVQWPWLSFPACLALLAALFFLMVIGTTTKQGSSVWKASPLPWVLRAERPDNDSFLAPDGSCKGLTERSTHIAVRLSEEDLGGSRIHMADLKDPNML